MNRLDRDNRRIRSWKVLLLSTVVWVPLACGSDGSRDLKASDTMASDSQVTPTDLLDEIACDSVDEPRNATDLKTIDSLDFFPDEVNSVETVDIDEESYNCHTDCWGGLKCESGVMRAASSSHIPCWVDPDPDCFDYGYSWECVSGECGESLCRDDEEAVDQMLAAAGETRFGKIQYNIVEGDEFGIVLSDESGVNLLELSIDWNVGFGDGGDCAGTTSLVWSDISSVENSLFFEGELVEVTTATLTLLQHLATGDGWVPVGPEYVGGVDATLADGRLVKAAWRGLSLPGCMEASCKHNAYAVGYSITVE